MAHGWSPLSWEDWFGKRYPVPDSCLDSIFLEASRWPPLGYPTSRLYSRFLADPELIQYPGCGVPHNRRESAPALHRPHPLGFRPHSWFQLVIPLSL